jgi:hypothetical protein
MGEGVSQVNLMTLPFNAHSKLGGSPTFFGNYKGYS